MTADEKNHVISNANEELDRQIIRLDTVFPYIAGEISEEARLGSMSHWAYSNKSTAKAATNERPRREAVSQRQDIAYPLHEAEVASRSEARREAVQARRRRNHIDADYEEPRGAGRKTNTGKSRADNAPADQAPKRRKVERPTAIDMGAPMERSASGTGNQRASAKDGTEKKRSRAPNSTTAAARKKYVPNQVTPNTHKANCLSLLPQAKCHIQCWIARVGPLTSYRNIQCPARSCKPRPQHSPTTVFTSSAECWSNKRCPPAASVLDFQPTCPRECLKAI